MTKVFKIIGVVAGVAVILLAVSSLVLHILLPPQKAKALVLKQLTGHLKREVSLGDIAVGVLSGLEVADLKISEAPDFAHGTFISSDRFSIRLALLPLLFRRVEVKQLHLNHLVITIIRRSDGKTFNFSDLMAPEPASHVPVQTSRRFSLIPEAEAASTTPAAPPTGQAGSPRDTEPPFALLVSRAQTTNGLIHFVDQSPANQSADL